MVRPLTDGRAPFLADPYRDFIVREGIPLHEDFVTVGPGETKSFTVNVYTGKNAGTPQLGWMVVTLDDANGAAQADLIPIAVH